MAHDSLLGVSQMASLRTRTAWGINIFWSSLQKLNYLAWTLRTASQVTLMTFLMASLWIDAFSKPRRCLCEIGHLLTEQTQENNVKKKVRVIVNIKVYKADSCVEKRFKAGGIVIFVTKYKNNNAGVHNTVNISRTVRLFWLKTGSDNKIFFGYIVIFYHNLI